MRHNKGSFVGKNGLRLFEQSWMPKDDIKAKIILVHGYGEHSGRYQYVAEYLCKKGYGIFTFDLRGHGHSEGARIAIYRFTDYICDLDIFLSRIKNIIPYRPIFILGHSLGGTIVVYYILSTEQDVAGIVLSAPLLVVPSYISPFLVFFVNIISRILPGISVVKKIDSRFLSHDPNICTLYDSDPLVYRGDIPAREAAQINSALRYIKTHLAQINRPFLILHGTADKVVDIEGSKLLYECAISQDKTIKFYEGFYHEILNEVEKDIVLADIVSWIDAHIHIFL